MKKQDKIFMVIGTIISLILGTNFLFMHYEQAPPFIQSLMIGWIPIGLVIVLIMGGLCFCFHKKEIIQEFKSRKKISCVFKDHYS